VPTETLTQRFSSGAWLSPSLARFAAWMMCAGMAAAMFFLFLNSHGLLDYAGRPLGTDFSSFWSAGRVALQGRAAEAYDWSAMAIAQREFLGTEKLSPWSYPPVFFLIVTPLAMLSYLPAYFLWQGASLCAAAAAYRKILPRRDALVFGFGFPAVFICLGHGQTGFLTAALMAGGLLALRKQEIVAGVLFGLLIYKPQFGVLLPVALAAGGYWRAFAAAAITVLAAAGATYLIWGWPVWQAFFDSLSLTRTVVFEAGDTGFEKFQSAFSWVRLWHGPVALAYALQAFVAVAVAAAVFWIWRSRISFALQAAALLAGSLLVSPYTLDYDFVVFGMALAFLVAHGFAAGFRAWDKTLIAFAWFVPVIARSIAKAAYLPAGFFMLAAIFVLIVVRASEERARHTR
jgi:alpha-1,2-mannosyltransferase